MFRRVRVCAMVLGLVLAASWAVTSCGSKSGGAGGNLEDKRQKAMQEGEKMKATSGGHMAEQAKAPPPAPGGEKAAK
jgi:hypothetical protein